MEPTESFARVLVETDGVWKVNQLTSVLSSLEGLFGRIAVASHIADYCREMDYVISNLRALGYSEKGPTERWGETKSPTEYIARKDYVEFVSYMRRNGVDVQIADPGVRFSFNVDDLLDLVPSVSRPEIESIRMSSPGRFSLLVTDIVGSKEWVRLVERILEALSHPPSFLSERKSKARTARAKARREEAKARKEEAEARVAEVRARHVEVALQPSPETRALPQTAPILDYSVAVESLTLSLRDAGFSEAEIKRKLTEKIMHDSDILARYKSLGLIRSFDIRVFSPPTTKSDSPDKPD